MPITAADSITLALDHTKRQLFQPFRIGQWTKLAFVGLLAGELGSNGCRASNFNPSAHPGGPHMPLPGSLGLDAALLAAFITAAIVAALSIGIILMYIGSVMRFVLFDSVLTRECHIRWSWGRRMGVGWRYFLWKLGYALVTLGIMAVVIGIPVAIAVANGWFKQPKEHLPLLLPVGIVLFLLFLFLSLFTAVVLVLTKDFVIPQMALEDIGAMEGWRRLWAMIQADTGAYAGYIGMKIVLAIVVGILIGIVSAIVGIALVVPTAALGILAFLSGKAAGLTWTAGTITLAVVVVCVLLAVFLYVISLIAVPAIVFFPAYSMYFFAARYPQLGAVLYPSSPPAPAPAGSGTVAL